MAGETTETPTLVVSKPQFVVTNEAASAPPH